MLFFSDHKRSHSGSRSSELWTRVSAIRGSAGQVTSMIFLACALAVLREMTAVKAG